MFVCTRYMLGAGVVRSMNCYRLAFFVNMLALCLILFCSPGFWRLFICFHRRMDRCVQLWNQQSRQIVMRLPLVLGLGLLLLGALSSAEPSEHFTARISDGGHHEPDLGHQEPPLRSCSVHDLLPLSCQSKSREWSNHFVTEPPYDCTCATTKARYFCPTQKHPKYPRWEPLAATQGLCRSTTRKDMAGGPFPPNFKILLYGNSHLRQVVEAMMCMFPDELESKRVGLGSPGVDTIVPGDTQCRACSMIGDTEPVNDLQRALLNHQCIAGSADCRCNDDKSQYFFKNGAVVHYKFSNAAEPKDLDNARMEHGMDPLSSYDVVFMNAGNSPSISTQDTIKAAIQVQAAGTPFFWLSTYDGVGSISEWNMDQRTRFFASRARYVDVHCMMRGMQGWTRGAVEGGNDPHFCLPGPPNEIAVLLVKLVWAVSGEKGI